MCDPAKRWYDLVVWKFKQKIISLKCKNTVRESKKSSGSLSCTFFASMKRASLTKKKHTHKILNDS